MKIEKKHLWLGLGFIVLLVIVIVVASILGSANRQNAEPQMIFATPETTPTTIVPVTPIVTLPISTPTQSASYATGSVWEVVSIEKKALQQNGFSYDVATFALVGQSTVTLKAHCAEPQWPSPEIGHKYVSLNDRGVIITEEGIKITLQRFYILGVK